MSRFIETIHLKDGEFLNLDFHQWRVNRTFREFFPSEKVFQLEEFLPGMDFPDEGRFRCTLHYSWQPGDLKIVPYQPRKINKLILKEAGELEYLWKYADRSELDKLTQDLAPDEEIIIIKCGLVTDASYANLIFFDGKNWVTPSTPLLPGTKRQKLLEEGKINEAVIRKEDLHKFSKCCLINAMVDMGEVEIGMTTYHY
jgi:4-amino-4-deoxychorismate lyase